ncbi:MAG TPA: glucodextranase DOMON-like domain-containing protein, partial [bacterium]|nr:glucodextranase DOMON-like domain-containing protein [bacterium]
DANLDGTPDTGYPPSGSISGTVALSDATDKQTAATVDAYLGTKLYATATAPRGGGSYQLVRLPDGAYNLEAYATSYRKVTREGVVVAGGAGVEGIDFDLRKVTGAVIGDVSLNGPASDVTVYVEVPATGEIGGDGKKVVAGGSGSFKILTVEDGAYDLVAEARGYVPHRETLTIAEGDTSHVSVTLAKAIATRYVFIDSLGSQVYSKSISRSLPQATIYADLVFEPRDDAGNAAIFDASATDSVRLMATLLDAAVAPRGNVAFADTLGNPIPGSLLVAPMFRRGQGHFLVSDDSVEVLRIGVARGSIVGVVEVGVGELRPVKVGLSPATGEVTVGDRFVSNVQLLDASGNPAPVSGVAIRMKSVAGSPTFEPEVGTTDANGFFPVAVMGFAADTVRFTAEVEPGEFAGLPADTTRLVLNPAAAYEILSQVDPSVVKAGDGSKLTLQLVDRYGNAVSQAGVKIDLAISPSNLLTQADTPVYTDQTGAAVSHLAAGQHYGLVALEGTSTYPVEKARLAIDARLVANDEPAPEPDRPHSNAAVDLTTMFAWLVPDTLKVALDFASTWDGVHLVIALETKNDAAGGDQDPFQFPVYYRHTLRPDFVFTYKYTSNDYADLREWGAAGWEYWQLASATWTTDGSDPGKNAVGMVSKTESQVTFCFPLAAVGALGPGSTVRLEAYVTQETSGNKYTALDSDPPDATQDMLPAQGNWYDTATMPHNLQTYATYTFPSPGAPPALTSPSVTPSSASPGDNLTLKVAVDDAGGGIGDVLADLSPLGGDAATRLYDSGTGGDDRAGDGIWSVRFTVPAVVTQGAHAIWFTARDSLNIAESHDSASVTIVNPPEVIISVTDSTGDDHGPNITSGGTPVQGLYYYYPTNGVFAPGVFDIRKVDFMIDGAFLVIRVYLGDVPSSEAVGWNAPYPGETCTNPNKADLNLQKIDVYIDSKEGAGATSGLPYRYVDIARSDAWEFAAVSEGWWKGLIESNGQNSISFWNIRRLSNQIDFCDDHVANTVDVRIALSVLGNPTADDIKKWDFIITASGHDGTSDDQNMGGTRWVNQATSEWQFGGGADGEAGRERDANIIDLVAVTGEGKTPGRSQEEMLNYRLDDATRRFDSGQTACIIEATSSTDISPPVISPFATDGFAHAVWRVMDNAPAAFWTKIEDESDVDWATFEWRPLGESSWRKTDMVNIIGSYWLADLDPEVLRQAVEPVVLVDGTMGRPFEARITASDQYGNRAETPLITFAIPDENLQSVTATGLVPGSSVILYDGTIISVPTQAVGSGYDSYDFTVTPLADSGAAAVDLANLRSSMTYLGVARQIGIVGHKGTASEPVAQLASPIALSLHYPAYLGSRTGDEQKIGLFEYNAMTDRWIGLFGLANAQGNAVTADVRRAGAYGLFSDTRLAYNASQGLSGVRAEPNPFSPNGDGLYDETNISFYLARDADWVTVEIYDINGEPVRTIKWQQGLAATGRSALEIAWDGKDDRGNLVPYGIYVARVEVRFKVAPYNERQNIGIAVIK